MPTYEYVCRDCGTGLEVVQSFHDDALTDCPTCDGALRKKFSAAGIIFKGSGWHSKDYARTNGNGSSSDDPEPSSKSDTSGDSDGSSSDKTSGDDTTTRATSSTTDKGSSSTPAGAGSDGPA